LIRKVISGGQTGVDRAGLDAAITTGISISGYSPHAFNFIMYCDQRQLFFPVSDN